MDTTSKQLLAEIAEVRNFVQLLKSALLLASLDRRYDPNQPRVPGGGPGGGQWASGGNSGDTNQPAIMMAARRSRAYCDEQYKRDIFQCSMVGLRSCYAQAMVRLVACERGHTIPPLNY